MDSANESPLIQVNKISMIDINKVGWKYLKDKELHDLVFRKDRCLIYCFYIYL